MQKNAIKVVLLLALFLVGTGCRHNINQSNPKVVAIAALADAYNACQALENALSAANKVVESIETQEPDYYNHVKPLLKKVSAANKLAVHKIQQAKNDGITDWRSAYISIASSIRPSDLTTLGVKNPSSQIIIGTSISSVVAILEAIGGAR